MTRILILACLACASVWAQSEYRTNTSIPVGGCTVDIVQNPNSGDIWVCASQRYTVYHPLPSVTESPSSVGSSKPLFVNGMLIRGGGTSLPGTCSIGDIWFLTAGSPGLYSCTGANNWAAGSGGGGSMTWPGSAGIPQYAGGQAWGSSLSLTTTVANPGSDSNVASEKAIRTAIAAILSNSYPPAGVPQSSGSGWGVPLTLITTAQSPGADLNIPTEKAMQTAINARTIFGRTGAIAAQTGDYTAAQVTNAVDATQGYTNPPWLVSLPFSKLSGVSITENLFTFSNVTTANASATRHGLLPVLPNDSTQFLNGLGQWSVPPGTGGGGGGGGSMVYPGAGVAVSTGSAWATSLSLATTLGSPGVDTSIVSEKGIRTALNAAVGGLTIPTISGTSVLKGTSGNAGPAGSTDVLQLFSGSKDSSHCVGGDGTMVACSGTGGISGTGSVSWNTDSFTGNGSTTAYTLSASPMNGSLILILNGQVQVSGAGADYTVSGTTVTFTANSVPPSGSRIIAYYASGAVVFAGVGTSLPGTCVVGQVYFLSSGSVGLYQCLATNTWTVVGSTGGGFTPYGTLSASLPPLCNTLTWANQGSASCTNVNGGLSLTSPGSGSPNFNMLVKALPTPPYSFVFEEIAASTAISGNTNAGIVVRDSGTGKFVTFNVGFNSGAWNISYANFTDATHFNANLQQEARPGFDAPVFLKFADSGGNFTMSVSYDGVNYRQFYQESRTLWMASPNQIGIGVYDDGTLPLSMFSMYWSGI